MTVVAAALVDGERRVLLQQRGPGRSMAGLWEFPGGKVEEGELPEPALVRELKEELGIDVEAANLALARADLRGQPVLAQQDAEREGDAAQHQQRQRPAGRLQ